MKQNNTFRRTLSALVLLMASTLSWAYDFEVDGICYDINEDEETVKVTYGDYGHYSGDITIPSAVSYEGKAYNVTSIGSGAFNECYSLTSINIPEGVTSIGYSAFNYCRSLTSVTIPGSVTSIGGYAFYNCSSLTSITIPASVARIGEEAFIYCSGLTSVAVDKGNPVYDSRDNCNALIETATNTLIMGCQNTVIPEGVTSIGYRAFQHCSTLTSVTIPGSVTSIGGDAFYGCTGLTSVTIPESVTSIGNNAFNSCVSLTSVTIPGSVTSIGVQAFHNCGSLTSITIPESVTSIGYRAFTSCRGLISITVDKGNPTYDSRDNCNALIETATNTLIMGCQNTVIPESVTSIGDYAFEGCTGLTSITIPESVTSIGYGAFQYCRSLTSITIPGSVTSIGENAFYGCTGLTSVTIPESVNSIGSYAFSSCSSLTSVYSFIENPFRINDVFSGIADGATLYVPQGTKEAYESIKAWTEDFSNIVELNATGIADTPVSRAEGIAVYTLNGTKVNVKDGDLKPLPRGIYVVNGKKMLVK